MICCRKGGDGRLPSLPLAALLPRLSSGPPSCFALRPLQLRYANNSNYKNDTMIRKECFVSKAVLDELKRIIEDSEVRGRRGPALQHTLLVQEASPHDPPSAELHAGARGSVGRCLRAWLSPSSLCCQPCRS